MDVLDWNYLSHTKSCTQTLESLIFLVKTTVKLRNLCINESLNTSTNRIFPVPFKVMYSFKVICLIDETLLINFSIVFLPGLFQPPPPPSPINYWRKFPTQANFLKQYTYADVFAISQNERPVCIVFCFACSCKETSTLCFVLWVSIKKPTYCQLLTSILIIYRMFIDVILLNVILDLILQDENDFLLLIIGILYCWPFVPLVSFCSLLLHFLYININFWKNHLIQKLVVFKGWY